MERVERVVRHFQEELEQLKTRLLEMGGLAEERVRLAVKGLVDRDHDLIDQVLVGGDEPVNRLHIEIDNRCFTLLALYQPMAADLRTIVAAVKINTDLERVGDLAVNIAQRSISMLGRPQLKPLVDVPHMSKTVESMVRKSLDAFVQRDEALARSVLLSDDEVDELKNSVYQELLGMLESGTAPAGTAFDLIFIAHNLERVADHATNIAEDVLFLIKGIDVRHHHLG